MRFSAVAGAGFRALAAPTGRILSARMAAPTPVPVVFVSSHAELGGSERYLELLLEALGPSWVDRVISLADGPALQRLEARGVEVEVLETGTRAGLLLDVWRLRRTLLGGGRRPVVVHANGVKAALVCGLAMARTSVPVVWVKHDFSWDGRLGRAVARNCTEVVGVSVAVLEVLRRGRPRLKGGARLTVVPNGIPAPEPLAPRSASQVREALHVSEDARLVTLVGRLHRVKGQLELVECMPAVLARVPDAHVALVGPEDATQSGYIRELRRRIAALGLEGRVHETGPRDDIPAVMAASEVVVIPSVRDERGGREGFGLAGIEALSVGTPVVGFADGALPEVLADAALLVGAGDRAALADAIARVLEQPDLAADLAARGRARFAGRFTIEATASAMEGRYRALAAEAAAD